MPVAGVEAVAKNIVAYGGGFKNFVNKQMRTVKNLLDREVTENISLPNSLEALALLDHPYARRHGEKGSEKIQPWYGVNVQSGRLKRAKESGVIEASFTGTQLKASAFVKLDENQASHILHVIFGTSKMIPRPVLTISRDNVAPEALAFLRSKLKNFNLSFKAR